MLGENRQLNGLDNLYIENSAVSDRRGAMTLYTPADNGMLSSLLHESGSFMESVQAIPFADIISEHEIDRIDFLKMDVEGAEWESLMATPDTVLNRIEQLPMELHGTDQRYLDLVQKLKRTFYLVHLHFNNMACAPAEEPLPAFAYQVLWVNRRIGVEDTSAPSPVLPNAADAPDNPAAPDCQLSGASNPR